MSVAHAESFRFFVQGPTGFGEQRLQTAAIENGCEAVFDFEWSSNLEADWLSVADHPLLGSGKLGMRLAYDQLHALPDLDPSVTKQLFVVLTCHGVGDMIRAAGETRANVWREVLIEISDSALLGMLPEGRGGVILNGVECGGRCGKVGILPFLQLARAKVEGPLYVRLAAGVRAAAACRVGGADGVILDDMLLLLDESPLPDDWKEAAVANPDTHLFGETVGCPLRLRAMRGAEQFRQAGDAEEEAEKSGSDRPLRKLANTITWNAEGAWPVGQGFLFAPAYAQRFGMLSGLLAEVRRVVEEDGDPGIGERVFHRKARFCRETGTEFPIIQGPMTRVSDSVDFAREISEGGALPMIALALLRGEGLESLLERAAAELAGRPWGVGILGFVPEEIRAEQIEALKRARPGYAIIAGGRPDQAVSLEEEGITTWLHVASPALLKRFLERGARRFIFEGRECGGHVGPLGSAALWDAAVGVTLEHLEAGGSDDLSIVFAGGVHDRGSAAMAAAFAAPLAARRVRVGVLMGTAYLFTREAVEAGAIGPEFQEVALQCSETRNLPAAPGHANRCAVSPFTDEFLETRRLLLAEGVRGDALRARLDEMTLGRLRIASKGVERDSEGSLSEISPDEQRERGMFMIGEAAMLSSEITSIRELHEEIAGFEGEEIVDEEPVPEVEVSPATESVAEESAAVASEGAEEGVANEEFEPPVERDAEALPVEDEAVGRVEQVADVSASGEAFEPSRDVAIIGISVLLPGAQGIDEYWRAISRGERAIREVPADRWDWRLYYDPDRKAPDKSYSKWGGFFDDIAFDPVAYGIPPKSMKSLSTVQIIAIEMAHRALADSGYADRAFERDRTAVILANADAGGMFGNELAARSLLPVLSAEAADDLRERLPSFTEDALPGTLNNLAPGRVANRLDLGGPNFSIDAACASSLCAIDLAMSELNSGRSRMALVGGAETVQTPLGFIGFSKVQALSPTGDVRPFDQNADGIVLSDGFVFMVLKPLRDAERDGDSIYAVLKGAGSASDGRGLSLTAPRPEGQRRALDRAYEGLAVSPGSLELYEAHATGTSVGDHAELRTILEFLADHGARPGQCALGSVKSLIGHTKTAAGLASLTKVCLALKHRVIPGHYGLEEPLPELRPASAPGYVLPEAQPWFPGSGEPRLAGVSAFGFGGTNSHVIVEEYSDRKGAPGGDSWPAELFLLSAQSPKEILDQVEALASQLEKGTSVRLRDLAFSLARQEVGPVRATLVASSVPALAASLRELGRSLRDEKPGNGVGWRWEEQASAPKVALLFPGQGSQAIRMLREPTLYFEELRDAYAVADRVAAERGVSPLSRLVFPPRVFDAEGQQAQEAALRDPRQAQPALAVAGAGIQALLVRLGLHFEGAAGHSFGEWSALHAVGRIGLEDLISVACERGRLTGTAGDSGKMAALKGSREQAERLVAEADSVFVANHNAPDQIVVSGTESGIDQLLERAREEGISGKLLPVAGAFHSPAMGGAQEPFRDFLESLEPEPAKVPVYSNATGAIFPSEWSEAREMLVDQLCAPVEFVREVEAMVEDGYGLFLEAGPGSVLSRLVHQIAPGVEAVSLDPSGGKLDGLLSTLGLLFCRHVPWVPERLFEGRAVREVALDRLPPLEAVPSSAWWVNSCGVRRQDEPHVLYGRQPIYNLETRKAKQAQSPAAPPPQKEESHSDASEHRLEVFQAYQESMRQFLETHERVMRAFLDGASGDIPAGLDLKAPAFPMPNGEMAPVPAEPEPRDVAAEEPARSLASEEPAAEVPPRSPATGYLAAEKAALEEHLRKAIAERTGYPVEMVEPTSDLEGDLGIDSLTRVEIIESVLQEMEPAQAKRCAVGMENISRARSPEGLAAAIAHEATAGIDLEDEEVRPVSGSGKLLTAEEVESCPRYVFEGRYRALPSLPILEPEGLLLVTRDSLGVAELVAQALQEKGGRVELIDPDVLGNDAWLKASIEHARSEHGPVCGILHLAPLSPVDDEAGLPRWQDQENLCARGLFRLLHLCGEDLRRGGTLGRILGASLLGGAFGRNGTCGPGSLFGGAATGLFKSLENEWENVLCKAVDFDGEQPPEQIAEEVLNEFLVFGGELEVGYPWGRRTVFQAVSADVSQPEAEDPFAKSRIVVALGGARGICHEILLHVVRPGMTLVIGGRTPVDEERLPQEVPDRSELRREVLAELDEKGGGVTPAEAEREVDRRLQRAQTAVNLQKLRESGADVRYRTVDARDPDDVYRFLRGVVEEFDRVDILLHAAGVVRDKLLEQKSLETFDEVFQTKVNALPAIERALPWNDLKLVALFGSVAGRFGNRGQTDYAAANEVLNRAGWKWKAKHPESRVVAINWGPWLGSGMASDAVVRQLRGRGIEPVRVDLGVEFFLNEVSRGGQEVEVVAGKGPWGDLDFSDADALVEMGAALVPELPGA